MGSNVDDIPAEGKVVMVTGGASGIGLAMVRHFASEGNRVVMLDINASTGPSVAAEVASSYPKGAVSFKKCDVSSWVDLATVFKEVHEAHGRIDIVMANAGVTEAGTSPVWKLNEETPSEPSLKTLNVDFVGVYYSVKLAIYYLSKNASGGSIICTASNAALYPFPMAPLYAASKAAVVGLVRSIAQPLALGPSKIQINALAPSVIQTNIAPEALFKHMKTTPVSTVIRAVSQFIADPTITGLVAEVHGDNVTLQKGQDWVDEDSRKNLEMFWTLGYA